MREGSEGLSLPQQRREPPARPGRRLSERGEPGPVGRGAHEGPTLAPVPASGPWRLSGP